MSVIVFIFLISFFILQFYYWYFISRFAFHKVQQVENMGRPPISIVICGKNAAYDFEKNVPIILQQDYPEFEIILVNDHSTDHTEEVMQRLASNENIKIVEPSSVPNRPGKKAALYEGVKHAQYEWVVVTDADCLPMSKSWLIQLAQYMTDQNHLILGISPNTKEGGFWKGLFQYETLHTAMLYISFALQKSPYMGVGRNMAFRKSVFLTEFVKILKGDIASGDDDLYVNFVSDPKTTAVSIHPDSYTVSESPSNLSKWFTQKKRHMSAGFLYKASHKFLLILMPLTQWIFLGSLVVLLLTPFRWFVFLLASFQFLVQQLIHSKILQKMDQIGMALTYPLYQLIWLIFQPYITFTSLFQSKQKWS